MASDGSPGAISGAGAVLSSQAAEPTKFQLAGGKTLPQSGNVATAAAAQIASDAASVSQSSKSITPSSATAVNSGKSTATKSGDNSNQSKSTLVSSSDPQSLVAQINKYLNDSGQADQFRLDPDSNSYIQQVNPTSGAVIAQYSVSEFPALARSIGISGLLVDEVA